MSILVLVLAGIGVYCGWRYYGDVVAPEQEIAAADEAQQTLFRQIRPAVQLPERPEQTEQTASEVPAEDLLSPAREVNNRIAAWLTIPGTHIDYPVVQGTDNDFYLHHGFDGAYNQELGCPFLDCNCEPDFSGFNSIVYAHHMTKQRMFADIARFKDETFLREHAAGYLTLPDGTHTVEFFAYLTVPSDAAVYRTRLNSEEERRAYLQDLLNTAAVVLHSDIDDTDRLLLLSTCTYEFEEARGILAGVIR